MSCDNFYAGCKKVMQKVPARNYIVLMIFLTTYINYTTRSNMSISLPAMVSLGINGSVAECLEDEVETKNKDSAEDTGPKYDWNQDIQGLILGGYFYGYMFGSLPAGLVAEWIGPFKTIFWSTVFAGILNSIGAWVTPIHWAALFVARFFIGFVGGLVYPALQCLIGRWSPPQERGKFVSGLMGNTLGTCLTWIFVGAVTKSYKWQWGFHILTIQIVFYLLISLVFLDDSPETSKWIAEEEFNFIKTSQEGKVSKSKTVPPYKKILSSFAFWTLAVLHFGNLWGLYVQITAVPKFMKEFIGFDIRESGVLSSLPHLLRFFMGIGYGQIGDLLKRKKVKRVYILKSFVVLSHIVPGILMGSMSLAKCNAIPAVVLLILSMCINGAAVMTNLSNPTDLSPNFAGTIFGIISFTGGISGFIVPSITGAILKSYGNNSQAWSLVFVIGGVIYCGCGIFFIIFGSADVQPWNEKAEEATENAGKSAEQS